MHGPAPVQSTNLNSMGTLAQARTGTPSRRAGSKRHSSTASTAASSSESSPLVLTTSACSDAAVLPDERAYADGAFDALASAARRIVRRPHVDDLQLLQDTGFARSARWTCRPVRRRASAGPGSPGSSSSPNSYCLTWVSGGTGSVVGVSTRIGTGRVKRGFWRLASAGASFGSGLRSLEFGRQLGAAAVSAGSPGRRGPGGSSRFASGIVSSRPMPAAWIAVTSNNTPGGAPREAFVVDVAIDAHR